VNEIQPYEQLIATKLDQLPIPDMSDSIWSGIEKELDAPAGSSDEHLGSADAGADKPASAFNGKLWFGLAGIVVVVALLLWYFSHKAPAPPPSRTLPETHAPVPGGPPAEDSVRSEKPAKKKDIPVSPVEIKKDTAAAFHAAPMDSVRTDSVVRPILPPIKVDSGALQRTRLALPDVDFYAVPPVPSPGGKKHKGVKGITDDDYKISAGKDSAKKRN